MEERFDSWKAIAAYLEREVRTVQRWAETRQLPVHHLPGGNRPRVFALKPEIDAWMRASGGQRPARAASVAVLPFLNLAGDVRDQHFGDGLAEDVINQLVRIPGLRVTARTSAFGAGPRPADIREIGARLGVTWLLEGSVRRDRKRIRVSAQLVNARDGFHAWSERYDRDLTDLFAIQDEIAASIAAALALQLAEPTPAPAPPDLVAWDLWVRGRALSQQFTPEAMREARECYEAAIARDPGFARPYFGLADLLFNGAQFGVAAPPAVLPQARKAILRSLELDRTFGEAHALLGVFRGPLDYDWSGAEAAFGRALELSPGSAAVRSRHSWFHLVPRMKVPLAVEEAREAVALDPLSPVAHGNLGMALIIARKYPLAVEATRKAIELAPGLWWLHWFHGNALAFDGQLDEGLRECWSVYEKVRQPLVVGAMALMAGLFSEARRARDLLGELEAMSQTQSVPPLAFGFAYLGLGDDRVFEWLDRAITARDPIATHMPSMPIYDRIRGDPRFRALLARMNLA